MRPSDIIPVQSMCKEDGNLIAKLPWMLNIVAVKKAPSAKPIVLLQLCSTYQEVPVLPLRCRYYGSALVKKATDSWGYLTKEPGYCNDDTGQCHYFPAIIGEPCTSALNTSQKVKAYRQVSAATAAQLHRVSCSVNSFGHTLQGSHAPQRAHDCCVVRSPQPCMHKRQ